MELEQLNFERDLALNSIQRIVDCSNDVSEFRVRVKELNSIKKSFFQVQGKIEKLSVKMEIFSKEEHLAIRNKFDSLYYQIQVTLDTLKETRRQSVAHVSAPCGHDAHAHCNLSLPAQSHIRLPKISLHIFDGKLTEWNAFHDLFKSLVHDNETLSNVERFRYLLLSLRDEPLNLIKSIPVTNANYTNALKVLRNRYENKRIISTKHFDNIFDVEPVNEKEVQTSLRHLLNTYLENVTALDSLEFPVDEWNFVLLNILLRKLTPDIRRRFELSLRSSSDIPSVTELLDFLQKELSASEVMSATVRSASMSVTPSHTSASDSTIRSVRTPTLGMLSRHARFANRALSFSGPDNQSTYSMRPPRNVNINTKVDSFNTFKCVYCKENSHALNKCDNFQKLNMSERKSFINANKICSNCLFFGHDLEKCSSRHNCRYCSLRHHSSICDTVPKQHVTLMTDSSDTQEFHGTTPTLLHGSTAPSTDKNCTVLLTTALVNVRPMNNDPKPPRLVRALVDQGSQATLITESCVQRLGLSRYAAQKGTTITGICDNNEQPRGFALCEVTPHNKPEPKLYIEALILPKITSYIPNIPTSFDQIPHLRGLPLADPELRSTRPVEILLGSDYTDSILLHNNIIGPLGTPVAINSIFGYLLNGRVSHSNSASHCINLNTCQLDFQLQRFWELESLPERTHLTKDELNCESIFINTHKRDLNGKYTVYLPFKENAPPLGESRAIALSRLNKLEVKLSRDSTLRAEYNKCMQEYLTLGHMEPVNFSANKEAPPYYIPHHCVVKKSATTTKYRVVYDASCKTTSGRSLNDNLLTGQKLHQDITEVLLKFRLHNIVFTADIKMMYRFINLCTEHRDFQRILWRFSPQEPVRDFRLCTVTFGVASAPFLALRTLHQLAVDEAASFPLAAQVLLNDVFVDDIVTGADSIDEAIVLQRQLIGICKAATFELRKWTSNSPEFLESLSNSDSRHNDALILSALDADDSIKVLGLKWNPKSDTFTYHTDIPPRKCTKRIMLAEIAKIYDPLGFLSPITLFVKHLIQLVWVAGTSWDEAPPKGVCELWYRFIDELSLLQDIILPRHILPSTSTHQVQLHGFSDASEKAYAACVYIRVVNSEGTISTHLLLGKTKVAPLKQLTIPRLELCGAHLLSKLIKRVLTAYNNILTFDQVFAWCDSSVTLAWLHSSPHKWRTYVSNRIAETTSNVPASQWHHVQSADNPADSASRGVLPSQLDQQMWFNGPSWLTTPQSEWPVSNVKCHTDEESRKHILITHTEPSLDFLEQFSSLPKLLRIVSLMFRFYHKCHKMKTYTTNYVTVPELIQSRNRIISLVQAEQFSEEISRLKDDDRCTKRLQKLKPFLDEAGLLRVGGRISCANVPYDAKHQILLPKKHHFTNLLIDYYHKTHMHVGPQTLQYVIAQNYWILSARDAVRMRTLRCVPCVRARPIAPQPPMAQLPAVRVRSFRPFLHVGVDFAGPFNLKFSHFRNAKILKSYVCVFVCMSTKAIHLELVPDLSTNAFLNTLRRFISRRGLCTNIYSDCGRNFVGCDHYLAELYTFLRNESNQFLLNKQLNDLSITWHFNPPYASHFGGIFEAAVKSMKSHLHRVIGKLTLNHDEFNTILCQIEAVLNSRPLCLLSNDPTDPLPLTPGHFLIGESLTALPEFDFSKDNSNRLVRWQVIQQATQHIWKRWSVEYLHQLQPRGKWFHDTENKALREDSVVVLIDNTLPPLQWRLARVHQLHPGTDGITRVVTVRMGHKYFKRPVVKVCPLPIE